MRFASGFIALGLGCASTVLAQTFTDCDPLQKTCPADKGLAKDSFYTDFTASSGSTLPSGWSAADGTTMTFGKNGAEFTMAKPGQAPTIETDFYIFFGTVEITMKSAPGPGVISSVVLESDDLDEIDFEFFGSGQYQPTVETNFFGKGDTSTYNRATYHPVSPYPEAAFRTYKIDWTEERLIFSVDGAVIRTLAFADPLANGGKTYPQTPMRLKLGNWAGGASGEEGTVEWAGGLTNYDSAPYVMYVTNVTITNANPATSYTYSDRSGSYQSIKMTGESGSLNVDGSFAKGTVTADAQGASSTRSKTASSTPGEARATGYPTKKIHNKVADNDAVASSTVESVTTAAAATASRGAASTGSAHSSESAYDAESSASNATHTPAPVQQLASEAAPSLSRGTLAFVSIFTLGMCFWMV